MHILTAFMLCVCTHTHTQTHTHTHAGRRWPEGTSKDLRPVILCEYAHAMNNSVGNLDEYWAVFRAHNCLQGGFIWDWMDQGLLKRGVNGEEYWVYGGDHDEHVHDAMWNINGLVWPDRTWHPSCFQVKKSLSPITVTIEIIGCRQGIRGTDMCQGFSRDSLSCLYTALITFRNGYEARTLAAMGWQWSLEVDGDMLEQSALLALTPLPPGGPLPARCHGPEYFQ